jgi:hypothetical protein
MKLRTKIIGLILWTAFCVTIHAANYVCDNPQGCQAKRFEDGVQIDQKFRYGDMVSTEAGWVVHSVDGWNEI